MKKLFQITGSIIFIGISLCMIFLLGELIRKELFMPTFLELEKQFAQKDIIRCTQSIDREIYHLGLITLDWAEWNEMYDFTEKYDPEFVSTSLDMGHLSGLDIDLVFIISSKGKIIVEKIYDKESESEIRVPSISAQLFSQAQTFMKHHQDNHHSASGILVTDRGPVIIAANTILPSSAQGVPRGVLIMGRFMSEEVVKKLKEQTLVSFSLATPDFNTFSERELFGLRQGNGVFITSADTTKLIGKSIFDDIYDNPALLITVTHSRDIYNQGLLSSQIAANIITFSFALFCMMGVSFFLFYRYKRNIQYKKTEALVTEKTQELTSLSSQLYALSEATTEGLMLLEDGDCIAMNKQTQKMFAYSPGEFDTHPTIELVIKEERPRVKKLIADNIEGFYETVGLRKDQSTFPLLVHGKSVIYNNINLRAVALTDLTARRQAEAEKQILEDKLQRSQKMESIGMLAGSVAHDLNNILSGVVTYPELLLLKLDKNSTFRQPLEAILASGKQAAEVVADLLTIARGIALVMVPININHLISSYLSSAEFNVLKGHYKKVRIQTNLTKEPVTISGSIIHINKVIMNLVTNSVEAISDYYNSTISLSTTVEEIVEDSLELDPGRYVVVGIADNGSGIPSADLDHIFEPFYSRKVKGRSGTGLGLTIVWNTMQDHNGTVTVKSDQHGTCFTLYFPVNEQAVLIPQDKLEINTLKGNNESILVVDDNPQQLDIANKILIALNYTVYLANSGEAALEFLERNKVDMVVLDMIMEPGISGYETYRKAIVLHPGLRALIASGFSVSEEVEKAKKLGASVFIRKPYSIAQIGSAIKSILAEG